MILFSLCKLTGPMVDSSELALRFLGQLSVLSGVALLIMFTRVLTMRWCPGLSGSLA